MKHILSLGAGVQSSTMAFMYKARFLGPMPDCGIFADTQGEPKAVYDWLDWMEPQLPFPIYRVTNGSLWKAATNVRTTRDGQRTYIETGIPIFTVDGLKRGLGKRQCTRDFKIAPITRKTRQLLGLRRVPKNSGVLAEMAIGISTDEVDRMKPSREPWIRSVFPLIDAGFSRADCIAWMLASGLPEPPRSACTFCPFHSDAAWRNLTPAEFADAAVKEKQLQAAYASASAVHSVPFLHSARVPLEQVQLKGVDPMSEKDKFRNECEGMCGV